jgi:hypothetical protein
MAKYLPIKRASLLRGLMCAVVGAFLAWNSAVSSFSAIANSSNPDLALRFTPNSADALAAKADGILLRDAAKMDPQSVMRLAKASLKNQAINARALRLAAYAADKERKSVDAAVFMRLSDRVSRREFGTQIWLIENAIKEDDIPKVLNHYDSALRTQKEAPALLFPVLTQAIAEQRVADALRPILKQRPPWYYGFVSYAIAQSPKPIHISKAIQQSGGMPIAREYAPLEGMLIGNLLEKSDPQSVKDYALSLSGVDTSFLTDIRFTKKTISKDRFPLTWGALNDGGVTSNFAYSAGKLSLNGYAAQGQSGLIARRLMFLSPGIYSLEASLAYAELSDTSELNITIFCHGVGSSQSAWVKRGSSAIIATEFTIMPACLAQYIDITLKSTSRTSEAEFAFSGISLKKGSE